MLPASLFSGRPGTSTAPTSRASSICSSVGQCTFAQVLQRPSPPPQHVSDRSVPLPLSTPPSSCGHSGPNRAQVFQQPSPPPQRASDRSVPLPLSVPPSSRGHSGPNRPMSLRFDLTSEAENARSHAKLACTASFYHLPLSMDGVGHSLSAAPQPTDEGNVPLQVRT